MSSSSSDPSQVSSGISLPQWMTNKISDPRFDGGDSFSPPSHDDSFFYIRYPIGRETARTKSSTETGQNWEGNREGYSNLADLLREDKTTQPQPQLQQQQQQPKVDYSKHTKPCQQFINGVPFPSPTSADNPKDRPQKSNGTDDGFTGKGAACGSSIVKVAKQMIANGSVVKTPPISRNNTVAALEIKAETEVESASGAGYDFSRRRGSKSLPASPLGSPKTQRRSPNPYFTGTFFVQPVNNTEQSPRGWLLSSLLGSRSDVRGMSHPIEEAHEAIDEALSASIDDLGMHEKKSPVLKAKPSELREMNFWSPTSM